MMRPPWLGTHQLSEDIPLIDARLDGMLGSFALDTGNGGTTVIQQIWADGNGLAESFRQGLESVSYGAGGISHAWTRRANTLEIAGTTLERPITRLATDKAGAFSRTEAGNIGTEVLAHFTLTFDYARQRICFEPKPGFVPRPYDHSGLRAQKMPSGVFNVALVIEGSPAAQAGIAAGDDITEVDGQPAAQLSGNDLSHRLRQSPGTRVSVAWHHKDDRRHAEHRSTLILRELLP